MLIYSLHCCGFSADKPFSLVIPSIRAALHVLYQVMSTVLLSEHNSHCVVWTPSLCSCMTECPFVLKDPLPTGYREPFCPQFPQATAHQMPLAEMPEPRVRHTTVRDQLGWRGWAEPLGCLWLQGSLSPSHKLLCYCVFSTVKHSPSSSCCHCCCQVLAGQREQQKIPPPVNSLLFTSLLLQLGKNEAKALPK